MKYMGGKHRLRKYLLPIILEGRTNETYYDLFCGGGKMSEGVIGKVVANDISPYPIAALELIRDRLHDIPKNNTEFTKEDYLRYKASKGVGVDFGIYSFAGFQYSYGAKFYGVWVRNNQNKDYVAEAYRSAVRQHTLIQNITYTNLSYDQVDIDDGSIIYCDIPYRGASKYVHLTSTFDFDAFYEWCRETKRTKGAKIFISEYGAPFECVFELQHNVSIATNPFQCTERLYRV